MTKIVYLASALIPSRTANSLHVMKMCQALSRRNHSVTLLNVNPDQNRQSNPAPFDYYGLSPDFGFVNVSIPYPKSRIHYALGLVLGAYQIIRFLSREKPELVVGRYLPGCVVAALLGTDVVFESHAPIWKSRTEGILFAWILNSKKFFRLVVITHTLKNAYRVKYRDRLTQEVIVLPDAADPVEKNRPALKLIKRREVLQVGYCGHLYRGKGVELILNLAIAMPEVDFHVVGGFDDDIRRFTVTPNLTFHGFVKHPDLAGYLWQFDIGLAPIGEVMYGHKGASRRQTNLSLYTSPLKIFEYMAYGLPIIASRLPAIEEVVTTDFGILANPNDLREWIAAVNQLKNKELRREMGKQAQRVQRGKYTWDARAENICRGRVTSDNHLHKGNHGRA